MADEKLNTGPAENTSPEAAGPITTPEQAAASEPRQEHTGPTVKCRKKTVGIGDGTSRQIVPRKEAV